MDVRKIVSIVFFYIFIITMIIMCQACKKSSNPASSNNKTDTSGYTGNFLAWTGSDDNAHFFTLVKINGQTGAVTNVGGDDYFSDLEYGPDGTLYGIGTKLCSINPSTGATTTIGDFHFGNETDILMFGASFSKDGKLYVLQTNTIHHDSVFTVDLSSGALTYVGIPETTVEDFAFAPDGTLYAAFSDLLKLNSSDMSTITDIGPLSDTFISSLTYGMNGQLYGSDYSPSTHIYTINTTTGATTPVVAIQTTGVKSIVAEKIAATAKIAIPQSQSSPKFTDAELRAMETKIKENYQKRISVLH